MAVSLGRFVLKLAWVFLSIILAAWNYSFLAVVLILLVGLLTAR